MKFSGNDDESENCAKSCEKLDCSKPNMFCQSKPNEPGFCKCNNGYEMVNGTCVDIDECQLLPPVCSQVRILVQSSMFLFFYCRFRNAQIFLGNGTAIAMMVTFWTRIRVAPLTSNTNLPPCSFQEAVKFVAKKSQLGCSLAGKNAY